MIQQLAAAGGWSEETAKEVSQELTYLLLENIVPLDDERAKNEFYKAHNFERVVRKCIEDQSAEHLLAKIRTMRRRIENYTRDHGFRSGAQRIAIRAMSGTRMAVAATGMLIAWAWKIPKEMTRPGESPKPTFRDAVEECKNWMSKALRNQRQRIRNDEHRMLQTAGLAFAIQAPRAALLPKPQDEGQADRAQDPSAPKRLPKKSIQRTGETGPTIPDPTADPTADPKEDLQDRPEKTGEPGVREGHGQGGPQA